MVREGRVCGGRDSAKAGAQTNKCKWVACLGHCGALNQACCVLILQKHIWPSISRSQSSGPRYHTICADRGNRPDLWWWAQAFPLYFISLLFQEKRKGRFILPLQRGFLEIACSKLIVSSGWSRSVSNKNKNSVSSRSFFSLCPPKWEHIYPPLYPHSQNHGKKAKARTLCGTVHGQFRASMQPPCWTPLLSLPQQ